MTYHCNKQVQQDDNVDHTVRAEHHKPPEARVSFDANQLKTLHPN